MGLFARLSLVVNSLSAWFSLSVFLLISLSLVLPSGYSLGALLLVVFGVIAVLKRNALTNVERVHKQVLAAVAVFSVVGVIMALFHSLGHRAYELPMRAALAILVFAAACRYPLKESSLLWGLIVGALGAGGVALWQWGLAGETRAEGYSNAIQFGNIALLWSALLLAGLPRADILGRIGKPLIILAITAGLLASLLSGARGGWLALPIVYGLQLFMRRKQVNTKAMLVRLGVALFCVLALYQFPQEGMLKNRIHQVWVDVAHYDADKAEQTSVGSRWRLWQLALEAISEKPFVGWGSFNKLQVSTPARQDEVVLSQFNHMHNDFLDAWVKRGIVGALSYLGLMLVPCVAFMRRYQRASKAAVDSATQSYHLMGLTLVVAVGVFGLTQAFLTHAGGLTLYVFLMLILLAQPTNVVDAALKKQ